MALDQAHQGRGRRVLRAASRPPIVLGFLVLVQWAAVLVFALGVRRNGWLFYQGGDQTFHYTASWFLAGGHVPEAEIGYGWSYLLAPLARAFGPNLLDALPMIVLLQTVVLLPLALYCVYGIAGSFGGRLLGYLAAAAWVIVPFAAIPLWDRSYHTEYVEQFLPQAFGMTGMGDFPSMVCLLVATLFCVRALDAYGPDGRLDTVLAGVAAGFAISIKPANALFLAGPLLAFAAARRPRGALTFGISLVPALLTLALWKYRGLGNLPVFAPTPEATAIQGGIDEGAGVMSSGFALDRYVDFDWDRLGKNYVDLRGVFWALPILQSLPLLGFVLATRHSWPKALLLGGWLGAFVLVKGSSDRLSVDSGDFLRLLMPGLPPLLILAALVPLLVPWFRRQPRLRFQQPGPQAGAVALAVFALLPVLLFAALPLGRNQAAHYFREDVKVPVDQGFSLDVRRVGREALVTWQPPGSRGVRVFYRVFRSRPVVPAPVATFPPGRDGVRCVDPGASDYAGAPNCVLEMTLLGATRSNRFLDRPPPGPWVYRVGLAANWRDDLTAGDVLLLSTPGRTS